MINSKQTADLLNFMPYKHKDKVRHKFEKPNYNVRNWRAYDEALRNRGSLTFWVEEGIADVWNHKDLTVKKRGGQKKYSDLAIQICLIFRTTYKMGLRQTEGFMKSLIGLLNLDLDVPDHTTYSRRSNKLKVIKEPFSVQGPLAIIVDSSGLKVGDAGGYDHQSTYDAVDNHGHRKKSKPPKITIPPNTGFRAISVSDHNKRKRNQQEIDQLGRERWQIKNGYGRRSHVEGTFSRYKRCIGGTLRSRKFENQNTEVNISVQILNKMLQSNPGRARKSA